MPIAPQHPDREAASAPRGGLTLGVLRMAGCTLIGFHPSAYSQVVAASERCRHRVAARLTDVGQSQPPRDARDPTV